MSTDNATPDAPALTPTEKMLEELMTERTSHVLVDSGDYYGRHYERNRKRRLRDEPEATFDVYVRPNGTVDLSISLSAFHWLNSRLEYNERLDKVFQTWARRPRNERTPWLQLAQEFPNYLARFGFECTGIYGEGGPHVVNSYNEETALDQTVQFVFFNLTGPEDKVNSEPVVLLSMHGGCDVRWGYSTARAFSVDTNMHGDETCIFDFGRLSLSCDGKPHPKMCCPTNGLHLPFPKGPFVCSACTTNNWEKYHRWNSDNGGYSFHDAGDGNIPDAMRNLDIPFRALDAYENWTPGTLWVLDEKAPLCPVCGSTLSAGSY